MPKEKFIAIKNQAESTTVELYFLDFITDGTYDWWTGMYESKVQEIIDKVNFYKPSRILCVIDSGGGDAQTGLSIYNFLKRYNAKVEVEIIGLAGSIASVIAMAANKGKLRIARNAFMMIHRAEGYCGGTSEEIRAAADLVDLYTSQIVDIYAQRTGKSVDEVNGLIANGDYWMTGEDCVAQGFADETFNETPNLQIAARLDTSVYKNIPAQIRAQMAPKEESKPVPDDYKTFLTNQFDGMKKFFTDIINSIKGIKPSTDPAVPITNQIADAMTQPFEKVAEEIDKTITETVSKATTEDKFVTNMAEKVVATLDFAKEGPAKTALDGAVKVAVENATKDMVGKITALETANATLTQQNADLTTEIANMKGGKSSGGKEKEEIKNEKKRFGSFA